MFKTPRFIDQMKKWLFSTGVCEHILKSDDHRLCVYLHTMLAWQCLLYIPALSFVEPVHVLRTYSAAFSFDSSPAVQTVTLKLWVDMTHWFLNFSVYGSREGVVRWKLRRIVKLVSRRELQHTKFTASCNDEDGGRQGFRNIVPSLLINRSQTLQLFRIQTLVPASELIRGTHFGDENVINNQW